MYKLSKKKLNPAQKCDYLLISIFTLFQNLLCKEQKQQSGLNILYNICICLRFGTVYWFLGNDMLFHYILFRFILFYLFVLCIFFHSLFVFPPPYTGPHKNSSSLC